MYCRKCGAENADHAKFCGKCGAELVQIPQESTQEEKSAEKKAVSYTHLDVYKRQI